MLGEDLTQDRHYAFHEHGSLYDDDVSGNMFVGGEDEMDLPLLELEPDSLARTNAEELFKRISN